MNQNNDVAYDCAAGGLPCNKGHVYEVRSQEEWQRMENALNDAEVSKIDVAHQEL